MTDTAPTARTRVRRHAERGAYDRDTIYDILDAGLICYAGIVEDGQPFVIPTIHARLDDRLLEGVSIPEYVRHYQRPTG